MVRLVLMFDSNVMGILFLSNDCVMLLQIMNQRNWSNILVIGGCHFVGVNLVKELITNHNYVRIHVIDDCKTAKQDALFQMLKSLPMEKAVNVRFHKMSIIDGTLFQELLYKIENVYEIYYITPLGIQPLMHTYPIDTFESMIRQTRLVMSAAYRFNAKIVVCSSPIVYGMMIHENTSEDTFVGINTLDTNSCYVEVMRSIEAMTCEFVSRYRVRAKIARIYNPYGPYMSLDTNDDWFSQALSNVFYGSNVRLSNQLMTSNIVMCYVDDVVEALLRLARSDHVGAFNIGGNEKTTVINVLNCINEVMRLIGYDNLNAVSWIRDDSDCIEDDDLIYSQVPNISNAKYNIGFEPKIGIVCGITKTLEHFERVLKHKVE